MFRLVRTLMFRVSLTLTAVTVLTTCAAGYLALQEPAFYADLRKQQFTPADELASRAYFELVDQDYRRWRERSLALQRAQLTNPAPIDAHGTAPQAYDAARDTYYVTLTEAQFNARLAAEQSSAQREWRNLRVQFRPDCFTVAFELATSAGHCVVSTDLKPALTPGACLQIEPLALRVGRLRLPLDSLLRALPADSHALGDDVSLDLTGSTPHFRLDLTRRGPEAVAIRSIQCGDGKLTLGFAAPTLERP